MKLSETTVQSKLDKEIVSLFDVSQKVSPKSNVLDDLSYEEYPQVSINDLPITWLTETIASALENLSLKDLSDKISAETKKSADLETATIPQLLSYCASVTLGARLADVNKMRIDGGRSNVEYPSLFGPFIAAYGRVENQEIGLTIIPVPSPELTTQLVKLGCIKKSEFNENKNFTIPEWYKEFMRFFRVYHLMTNYGLPKDVVIKDDSIYQITTVSNSLIGRQSKVSPDVLLIATMLKATSMATIFGQYRVEYGFITAMRSAIEDIALKAIHLSQEMK